MTVDSGRESGGLDYVSLTGTKPGLARGRDFAALSPANSVLSSSLQHNMQLNAQVCRYMTTNMVLNIEKGITIKQGVG